MGPEQQYIFQQQQKENKDYLTKQLITYLGNKRSLLDFLGLGLEIVLKRLNKRKLSILDPFSGSGIVSRYFKPFADMLIVNDLERYAEVINRCYLTNSESVNIANLTNYYKDLCSVLGKGPFREGIISQNYAPKEDDRIKAEERVFYTARNARYIDTARQAIEELPAEIRDFFLAPLLTEASIHANTAGVFKGFYKDPTLGIGKFGGKNGDALSRIKGDITLPFPIFSHFSCPVIIHRGDANEITENLQEVDLAYLDPPYNQHPYGSNYFMLNLIADYRPPERMSRVSGIPEDWKRSAYNKQDKAFPAFAELINKIKAKFILISFNSEGFIPFSTMIDLLNSVGDVKALETKYNTFRGSRNLRERNLHVTEYLYLVEKR